MIIMNTACEFLQVMRWSSRNFLHNRIPTFSSDVWSLACLFIEILTCRIPFYGINNNEVYQLILRGEYPTIDDSWPLHVLTCLREIFIEETSCDLDRVKSLLEMSSEKIL